MEEALLTETQSLVNLSTETAPLNILPSNGFAIRWEGFLFAEYEQVYTFYLDPAGTSERVRLFIDHQVVLDHWSVPIGSETNTTVDFGRGGDGDGSGEYRWIEVEYAEGGGLAGVSLKWETAGDEGTVAKAVVPSSHLFMASPFHSSLSMALSQGNKRWLMGENVKKNYKGDKIEDNPLYSPLHCLKLASVLVVLLVLRFLVLLS